MMTPVPRRRPTQVPLLRSGRIGLSGCIPVLGLVMACRSPQKTSEGEGAREAASATASASVNAPEPTAQPVPRKTTGDQPNSSSDASVTSSMFTRSVECMGGERRLTYSRRTEADDGVRATLEFSAAGHRSWSYQFHYRDGELQEVEHRVASWRFSDDTTGAPGTAGSNTVDTVLERRYRLKDAKAAECVVSRASGPSKSIEGQLSKAAATKIACSDVARIQALASLLELPTSVAEPSALEAVCGKQDPSSGMKL